MRNQRERRQEAGWSFFQYFLLQVPADFVFGFTCEKKTNFWVWFTYVMGE